MAAIFRTAIRYLVPDTSDLLSGMEAELTTINLVLIEGYSATRAEPRVRADLCADGGPWRS